MNKEATKMQSRIFKVMREKVSKESIIMQQNFSDGDEVVFSLKFEHPVQNKVDEPSQEILYVTGQLVGDGRFCLVVYKEDECSEMTAPELKSRDGMTKFLTFVNIACGAADHATAPQDFTDAQLSMFYEHLVLHIKQDVCGRSKSLSEELPDISFIGSDVLTQYMMQLF
ncbi:MAG: hypothetical protein K2Q45_02495 [Nitrosomonas sp.]|nr:hypothetical protein [Nitrosomonas sp.]